MKNAFFCCLDLEHISEIEAQCYASLFLKLQALTRTPADPDKTGRNYSRNGEAAGFKICSKLGSKSAQHMGPTIASKCGPNGSKIASQRPEGVFGFWGPVGGPQIAPKCVEIQA